MRSQNSHNCHHIHTCYKCHNWKSRSDQAPGSEFDPVTKVTTSMVVFGPYLVQERQILKYRHPTKVVLPLKFFCLYYFLASSNKKVIIKFTFCDQNLISCTSINTFSLLLFYLFSLSLLQITVFKIFNLYILGQSK